MEESKVWGSAPLVKAWEWCPACGHEASRDHPVLMVASVNDVTQEIIDTAYELVMEDDRGNVDWERLINSIEGDRRAADGRCWQFPLEYDDPVFNKIKREVRKMRNPPD